MIQQKKVSQSRVAVELKISNKKRWDMWVFQLSTRSFSLHESNARSGEQEECWFKISWFNYVEHLTSQLAEQFETSSSKQLCRECSEGLQIGWWRARQWLEKRFENEKVGIRRAAPVFEFQFQKAQVLNGFSPSELKCRKTSRSTTGWLLPVTTRSEVLCRARVICAVMRMKRRQNAEQIFKLTASIKMF